MSETKVQEPQILTAVLDKSELISARTNRLVFSVQDVDKFDFITGQFISVREPRAGGKHVTRAYSIASAPKDDNHFELCVNRVDEGFMSNYLCELPEGAKLHLHGPYGQLTLDNKAQKSVFVATGTGVAPFRGMLQWLFADESRHYGKHYWLVFGGRTTDDLLYRSEFEGLAERYPNFHYLPTLSRAAADWPGKRGYVQQVLHDVATKNEVAKAYLCGLGDMVKECRKLLKEELLWDKSRIVAERYN